MPIIIPESKHETFDRNSINSVICQIRFQPIFRIAAETPVDFQEKIRKDYPKVKREEGVHVEVQGKDIKPTNTGFTWRFLSEDENWQVTLDSAFIAFETKNYKNFNEFKKKFKRVFEAYNKVYYPSSPERIGLRYVNFIRPIQLQDFSDWANWVKPELLGFITDNNYVKEPIINDFKELRTVQEPGFITLRHGLVKDDGNAFFYLLDTDRFIDKIVKQKDIFDYLDGFNSDCYNLYRWAIGEKCVQWMKGDL